MIGNKPPHFGLTILFRTWQTASFYGIAHNANTVLDAMHSGCRYIAGHWTIAAGLFHPPFKVGEHVFKSDIHTFSIA